ncbi:hypothetical protein EG343_24130 [Chryseobacterium nakagawai]|uniref:Uncharacterized protein n=1 Tax=Chryseobacterium nakagawai TaxID=1241982 RepID=A0AAD0YN11_CHRNA|nr:hypothetical protein EG343_24130 [Chryseobacterium nakagawai]
MNTFYSNQVNPREVVKLLILNANLDANKVGYYYGIKEYSLKKKIFFPGYFFTWLSSCFP